MGQDRSDQSQRLNEIIADGLVAIEMGAYRDPDEPLAKQPGQPTFRKEWRVDLICLFLNRLLIQITSLLTVQPAMVFFGLGSAFGSYYMQVGGQNVMDCAAIAMCHRAGPSNFSIRFCHAANRILLPTNRPCPEIWRNRTESFRRHDRTSFQTCMQTTSASEQQVAMVDSRMFNDGWRMLDGGFRADRHWRGLRQLRDAQWPTARRRRVVSHRNCWAPDHRYWSCRCGVDIPGSSCGVGWLAQG